MNSLTVLICTHNRAELLERALKSLNNATRPHNAEVRVLVVANACTDATPDYLDRYQEQVADKGWLPLTWIAEPSPGKSRALNRAIPEIVTEIVAFVDDDHRVDENYLVAVCDAVDSYPDATLFCGRILPDWDGSEPGWAHDKGTYRIYPLPVPLQDQGEEPKELSREVFIPGGGNLILKCIVFERSGGFSDRLGPQGHNLGGGEDTAFVLQALRAGEKLQYVPTIKQFHYVDTSRFRLNYLLRKSFQRSRAAVETHQPHSRVPLYMWRKLAGYLFHAVFSLNWSKTRFYLVRVAAVMGEISGIRRTDTN